MPTRAQQREDTRERIINAAREAFAEYGFKAASTRDIAARASTTQGLITYHFKTKDELWRAAVGETFAMLRDKLLALPNAIETDDPKELAREGIREYVRFAAERPELFRLMVEQGKHADERMRWLVDTHLKPMYEAHFMPGRPWPGTAYDESLRPHLHYILAGAGSVIFAVAPECQRLTGLDPRKKQAVEAHADLVARLLVP